MTNEQLRAFIAVVEHGSFRAAATAIFKTQPTISASIKALEHQFDLHLLDREGYRPILTAEGKTFYRHAKQLVQQATELEMLGHELAQQDTPTLSLSLSAMCALPPGLDTIKAFCNKHPSMRLNINTEHLSGVLEQLQLDKADLAIGPHMGLDDHYEFIEISHINMITVMAPNSLPINTHTKLSHKALLHFPHILISDSGSVAPFDHVNVLNGEQRWYVNDYQMKKTLLLAGMGWARVPQHMIENELEQGLLLPLEIDNFNSTSRVPIYLIRIKHHPLSSLAKMFWEEMLEKQGPYR
jgi:DNA-binding transcriptional LysR family regulator